MARQSRLDIVREAIAIQGYIEMYSPRGRLMRVRQITPGPGGVWLTDHLSEDLGSRLRIPRRSQEQLVEIARGIIARADEIRAARERSAQAFRER